MSVDPNIFTEDIMTSLLQAPVQTGEGQNMSLTDIMQQWSNPVSMPMVSSGTPQCTTIEQPSISSPQTQSLLSELIHDLRSQPCCDHHARPESLSTFFHTVRTILQFHLVSANSAITSIQSNCCNQWLRNRNGGGERLRSSTHDQDEC